MNGKRPAWKTALGVILTAIMLFPVYWMINVSLTPTTAMRKSPPDLFPFHPTFEGYQAVISRAAPVPRHQPAHRAGHGRPHRGRLPRPPRTRSRKLRPRGRGDRQLRAADRTEDPGIIMAIGFYAIYLNLGILNTVWGLIVADSSRSRSRSACSSSRRSWPASPTN